MPATIFREAWNSRQVSVTDYDANNLNISLFVWYLVGSHHLHYVRSLVQLFLRCIPFVCNHHMGKDLKKMNLHSNVTSSYLDLFSIAAVHGGQFTKETFEFTDKL